MANTQDNYSYERLTVEQMSETRAIVRTPERYCPICGVMVSDAPFDYLMHMAQHNNPVYLDACDL
jgi:hypothetical protein